MFRVNLSVRISENHRPQWLQTLSPRNRTGIRKFVPLENARNAQAAQGAGIQAATLVAQHGPQAVLTGHCGPKAFQALQAAGIPEFLGVRGTVEEAVRSYGEGNCKPADAPDVSGHWS